MIQMGFQLRGGTWDLGFGIWDLGTTVTHCVVTPCNNNNQHSVTNRLIRFRYLGILNSTATHVQHIGDAFTRIMAPSVFLAWVHMPPVCRPRLPVNLRTHRYITWE